MKVKIITDRRPFVEGAKAMKGEEFEVDADAAKTLIENGFAEEVKVKRARNAKGQLKKDDPKTPDVNEAWEDGKGPSKKTKKKAKK